MLILTWRPLSACAVLQDDRGDTMALVARWGFGWAWSVGAGGRGPRRFGFVRDRSRAVTLVEECLGRESLARFGLDTCELRFERPECPGV